MVSNINLHPYTKAICSTRRLDQQSAETTTTAVDEFTTSTSSVVVEGAADPADVEKERSVLQSIVKVFCTHSSPNYFMPWQNKPQRESSGSGAVMQVPVVPGGVGILTNAHVVADQTFVMVRRHGGEVQADPSLRASGFKFDTGCFQFEPCF